MQLYMKIMETKDLFKNIIIKWHNHQNKRIMPWKGEKDPYKIWLSEIILQQTRVAQGLNYYHNFINEYPTILHLAQAQDSAVFKMWEGLGYYNRCKNLLATARYIAFELQGVFPTEYVSILALKGVGSYTAAAIASFAYNLPHAVVDGNVNRLLARYFNITTPIDSTAGKKQFANLAQQLLPTEAAALYNQAIMDFGATICKPKLPLCTQCPLSPHCQAYLLNIVLLLPIKHQKIMVKNRYISYIIASYKNKLYVQVREQKDIWQNLWQFIIVETEELIDGLSYCSSPQFVALVGKEAIVNIISPINTQQLTHQYIQGLFIHVALSQPIADKNYKLIGAHLLNTLAFPRFITAYLQTLGKKLT